MTDSSNPKPTANCQLSIVNSQLEEALPQLNLADLKVTYGCKAQVSLVLYALLKSGNIINKRTGKPVTLVDFTKILRLNGVNLDVANLCNRVIVNGRYNQKVLGNFLKQLVYTVEEKAPLTMCK